MTKKSEDKDSFENIARELECDESEDALDKAVSGLNLKPDKEQDSEEE